MSCWTLTLEMMATRRIILLKLLLFYLMPISESYSAQNISRRRWVSGISIIIPNVAHAIPFVTRAAGKPEYTNAITASRDTNVSPAEAYDVLREKIPAIIHGKALDLGAGAGVSTQVLYQAGYTTLDAVDWSSTAWDESVSSQPGSVQFYEASDDAFFTMHPDERYDAVVYNFAVNPDKAIQVARQHLLPQGRLLAPVNDRRDYWYKQTYWVLDSQGSILWKSPPEVGAWSVQFQPDVTSPTCTGIWCGNFNGFASKR